MPVFLLSALHRIQRLWWRVRRPTTIGVRVVLSDGGRVALVRHTYGDRQWYFPGGGVHRHESAADAAIREIREELGIALRPEDLRLAGIFHSSRQHKSDHIVMFTAALTTESFTVSSGEIAEAGVFHLDELPALTSPATRRRIEGLALDSVVHGTW